MSAKSFYLERKLLDHTLGTTVYTQPTVYIALHEDDPTDSGSDADEVSGGSYARQSAAFNAASTNAGITNAVNSTDIIWSGLPACDITHVAIWDSLTSGNMLYSGELVAPKNIGVGDGFTIPAGQLSVVEK